MSAKVFVFYTKWDLGELECACYVKNPLCEKYKQCEELELTLSVYYDITGCMKHRKYKKQSGVIKQL